MDVDHELVLVSVPSGGVGLTREWSNPTGRNLP
jgi:hypothetical protein